MILAWKEFNVNLDKVHAYFKANLSSNYDGLLANSSNLTVTFLEEPSTEDTDTVTSYWASVSPSTFAPTFQEIVTQSISNAIAFGNQVIFDATVENVALGITASGKTKVISDYFGDLQRYLKEGSLYAALAELERIQTEGVPEDFAPFITEERVITYKTRIEDYLGL